MKHANRQIMPGAILDTAPTPVQPLGQHVESIDGVDYVVCDANSIKCGTVSQGGRAERIVLTLLRKSWSMPFGGGLSYILDAQGARDVAKVLIDCADEQERVAADQTTAALDKARGR